FTALAGEIGAIAVAVEKFAGKRLRHHSRPGIAVNSEAQKRAPHRQAGNEGAGSIDGIDNPDMAAVDILRSVFFPQNAMVRKSLANHRPNRTLRRAVCFGHRIETNAIFVVYFRQLTKTRKRFSSRSSSHVGKKCLVDQQPRTPVSNAWRALVQTMLILPI